jgi:hypothetical protein
VRGGWAGDRSEWFELHQYTENAEFNRRGYTENICVLCPWRKQLESLIALSLKALKAA